MGEPSPQNSRRSQRVLLQIPVLIRTDMPGGQYIEVQAFTAVVNAHGGLLEVPVKLADNQKITLVNPQSGMEASCRVVRIEGPVKSSFMIAFEFNELGSRFWPITFPPEDWGVTQETAKNSH